MSQDPDIDYTPAQDDETPVDIQEYTEKHEQPLEQSPEQKTAPTQRSTPWLVAIMVFLMRLAVGATFIFSGFVKAIDPWGSMYKFQEYFHALGWEAMLPYALFAAFALAALEFTLGVQLAVGAFRRMAPLATTLLLLVMTPLTYWLATTNAVPDCGCFGDAMSISNWATFWKNVFLLAGAVFLFIFGRKVNGFYGPLTHWIVALLSIAYALALAFFGYFTQPLIDFRPYKIGTQLSTAAETQTQDYIFIYERDGKQYSFSIDSVPDDEDTEWKYIDRRLVEKQDSNAQAQGPAIAILDHGSDIAAELLGQSDRLLLFLFPDIDTMGLSYAFPLNELYDYATLQETPVCAITPATEQQIEHWSDTSLARYPIYNADDSDIKMMARGNPAVVYIQNGAIRWKRTVNSVDPNRIHDENVTLDTLSDDFKPRFILNSLTGLLLIAMLALLVVNRTHVLFRWLFLRKKDQGTKENVTE